MVWDVCWFTSAWQIACPCNRNPNKTIPRSVLIYIYPILTFLLPAQTKIMIFSRFLCNCGPYKHTIKTRRNILGHTRMVFLQLLFEGRSMNSISVSITFMVISFRKQQFSAYADFSRSHAWSPARKTRSAPHPHQYAEGFFDLGRSDIHIGRTNVSPAGADEKQ